jgi:hypothetical protein
LAQPWQQTGYDSSFGLFIVLPHFVSDLIVKVKGLSCRSKKLSKNLPTTLPNKK